jgi:TRAP-type mannitol/chloroaromatic compound transport system permease large subunit
MLFGLDGIEIGLLIVFICLFGGIMTGFPVAFAIGGSGIVAFAIIAALDSAGWLIHQAIDTSSAEYAALLAEGVARDAISVFRYPDLPRVDQPLFPGGWQEAMTRNIGFIVNRMNERVIAGQSIETLLAVLMFVMMGITLERSRIANDLLTTMARVFGPLPGGLAVSIVIVGAFLAASTGIVGATVVTMGLLALPTMLRNNYSPELATGVISASGTLGQIIPPSIVIVLLGTLAGDIYSTAQEKRASSVGCTDALTLLGEPAVVSVGTLFQAALLPGILLALLYALYAFGYALLNPSKAPPVVLEHAGGQEPIGRRNALIWFLAAPAGILMLLFVAGQANVITNQSVDVSNVVQGSGAPELRTNVSDSCKAAMIELHGQEKWDRSVAQAEQIASTGGSTEARQLSEAEVAAAREARLAAVGPIGTGVATIFGALALMLAVARGIVPSASPLPLMAGAIGVLLAFLTDAWLITPLTSSGATFALLAIPFAITLYGVREAVIRLGTNELVRVVFPPLILIVAVLGSILGGITNPTPAAALGAAGAIMLAAYRRLRDNQRSGRTIIAASFAIVIMIVVGANFDLRTAREGITFADWIAIAVAVASYHLAMFGLLYSCWVLFAANVLSPVVRETAKVTSMVFTILIGSQLLNLVVISFGGEHYIQEFLRAFDNEMVVFMIVMLVLFILGFVLDFLEIIYIVVPIVGPVIYGGSFDPAWVTIMIAVNLQTSFLTPPFGFALFYLRGVAPPTVTTGHIYRGVIPFVIIQVIGLLILWLFPSIVTIVPDLLPQ